MILAKLELHFFKTSNLVFAKIKRRKINSAFKKLNCVE